jgi:hypothetical protein
MANQIYADVQDRSAGGGAAIRAEIAVLEEIVAGIDRRLGQLRPLIAPSGLPTQAERRWLNDQLIDRHAI